jgi:hypothetical protein
MIIKLLLLLSFNNKKIDSTNQINTKFFNREKNKQKVLRIEKDGIVRLKEVNNSVMNIAIKIINSFENEEKNQENISIINYLKSCDSACRYNLEQKLIKIDDLLSEKKHYFSVLYILFKLMEIRNKCLSILGKVHKEILRFEEEKPIESKKSIKQMINQLRIMKMKHYQQLGLYHRHTLSIKLTTLPESVKEEYCHKTPKKNYM